jgi:hypothetical protein
VDIILTQTSLALLVDQQHILNLQTQGEEPKKKEKKKEKKRENGKHVAEAPFLCVLSSQPRAPRSASVWEEK